MKPHNTIPANIIFHTVYCRAGIKRVVEQLQMVFKRSACDSNTCKLLSEQAIPPILPRKVWCIRLQEEEIIKEYLENACVIDLCQRLMYFNCGSQHVDH